MNLASMDFLRLDPKYFKAFLAAAESGSFTIAAAQAAMTQSGVSQHVSKLEAKIGTDLFIRNPKNIHLTPAGKALLAYVRNYNDSIVKLMEEVQKEQHVIEGLVRYAMPPSCLLSPHFSMLLERRLQHPGLELKVELRPNDEILPELLNGLIDFGFVTERVDHQQLEYREFCQEEYILVSAVKDDFEKISSEKLTQLHFIKYPGMDVYFDYWHKGNFPENRFISNKSLSHAGEINSISGAIDMVVGKLGVSVFPRHCVSQQLEEGSLFAYSSENSPPVENSIHIVFRKQKQLPKRLTTVIDWFLDMHK